MKFTQPQLRELLAAQAVPVWQWQLPDALYETVSADYMLANWSAWIDALRLNGPALLTQIDLGGGKTRTVPRWLEEAGDCDDAAMCCLAHGITGNWLHALRGGSRVGRCRGLVYLNAEPRAENRGRSGQHAMIWFVDHEGQYRAFEPGDGTLGTFTLNERMTSRFGLAA